MALVALPVQLAGLVSSTCSVIRVPGTPEVNVMVWVPWPEVIVPPLMVQLKASSGLGATEATSPEVFGGRQVPVLITGAGAERIVTEAVDGSIISTSSTNIPVGSLFPSS